MAIDILPDVPNANVLAFELLLLKAFGARVKLFKLSKPKVNVKPLLTVRFAPNRNSMFELFNVGLSAVAPTAVVTTPVPELESKIASSAVVGAEAPLAPPDVADQFVVLLASQVPVPPTQYLAAILQSL